jgi:hypothetical protein
MAKICILLLLAVTLAVTLVAAGCASDNPGSREYIPGKGWVPMSNP